MPSPNQISVSQLLRLVGTPECPVVLDVCVEEDFIADPRIIPGAKRFPFDTIAEIAPTLIGSKVVVVCQKGLKLSVGASAVLRSEGVKAEYLEGGNFAWRDAEAPLIPTNSIPHFQNPDGGIWVTRHRPKIDRIACPWLIRRFVDRDAKFLFVEPSQVAAVAEKFDATPFDIENTFWGHRREFCTFDTMLNEFQINLPQLERMAEVIRAADTGELGATPEASGLSAILFGLSRMHKDDLQQLDAALPVLDALYRWCRDGVTETHHSFMRK